MPPTVTFTLVALLSLLSSGCYASNCANFSLPNFLDLGECLQTSGDLCTAQSEGIVEFLLDLERCFFEGVASLDIGNQFYLVYNYLEYLLERNDFDIVIPLLEDLCESFNAATLGTVNLSCGLLKFNKTAVCGKPIFIIVPFDTPFATCFNVTGLTCDENDPVDEPAVMGFIRVLACLIAYIFETAPSVRYAQLACDFVTGFPRVFGTLGYIFFKPILCAFQDAAGFPCSTSGC